MGELNPPKPASAVDLVVHTSPMPSGWNNSTAWRNNRCHVRNNSHRLFQRSARRDAPTAVVTIRRRTPLRAPAFDRGLSTYASASTGFSLAVPWCNHCSIFVAVSKTFSIDAAPKPAFSVAAAFKATDRKIRWLLLFVAGVLL